MMEVPASEESGEGVLVRALPRWGNLPIPFRPDMRVTRAAGEVDHDRHAEFFG
jgi:hypothetical protein